jgi:hypothetical protein
LEDNRSLFIDAGKSEKMSFTFDYISSPSSSQEDMYDLVLPTINDALLGYNATIFTYGQTGSGSM